MGFVVRLPRDLANCHQNDLDCLDLSGGSNRAKARPREIVSGRLRITSGVQNGGKVLGRAVVGIA